jgi:hypothetical protein
MRLALGSRCNQPAVQEIVECRRQPLPPAAANCPDLTVRETEAEAVTYLLCAQLGLDGTRASVAYIQSYRGTPDTLDGSLERIRTTAQRLSNELAAIGFGVRVDTGAT